MQKQAISEYQFDQSEKVSRASRQTPIYDPEGPQNYIKVVQQRANLTKNTLNDAIYNHKCSRSLSNS